MPTIPRLSAVALRRQSNRTLLPALVLLVGAAPLAAQDVASAPASPAFPEEVRRGLAVTPEWLLAQGDAPDLVILHVGRSYAEGHIPGSVEVPWDEIAVNRGERGDADLVRLDLPPELGPVRRVFEQAGVSDDSRVVVAFEGTSAPMATRVIWTLQVLGLGDRVALLDGGVDGWSASGGRLATEVPEVVPGRIAVAEDLSRRAHRDEVAALGDTPGVALLDARRPGSWDGSLEEMPGRAGHIPGARSLPALSLFDDAGRLRPEGELRDLFEEAGVQEGDTVVAYCHIGLWASAVVHAARTLGYDARLYDGSMTEWASDPELPLVRPEGPEEGNRRP